MVIATISEKNNTKEPPVTQGAKPDGPRPNNGAYRPPQAKPRSVWRHRIWQLSDTPSIDSDEDHAEAVQQGISRYRPEDCELDDEDGGNIRQPSWEPRHRMTIDH